MKEILVCLLLLWLSTGLAIGDDYLVPLDDRPANLLFVEQISRIGRPQQPLKVPPRSMLGRLYRPGDSQAVIEWVQESIKPGDTLFVSADMWLYGGLVASRTAAIDESTVQERLKALEEIGGGGVTVHVLATIPRLSLRTSDQQAPHEQTLSKWAAKGDLPSAVAMLEARSEGRSVPYPENVPEELVDEYLGVRNRNATTIGKLIELTRIGFVDSLVLGQDDSNKTGLHRFEQEQIKELIQENNVAEEVTLLSGIDELTMSMVSGVWAKRSGLAPRVRVVYSDPDAATKVPPLESLPLGTMIIQHLELSGAQLVESNPDVELYVYVPYKQPWKVPGEERRPDSEAFVKKVQLAMESPPAVAVADLSLVNRMDPFLAQSSLKELPLFDLEGFASWNTPANTVGTVVSQLVCHHIAENSPQWTLSDRLESEKTHQAFLLARFIDDYLFQTVVRDEVRDEFTGLSSDADPLLNEFGPAGLSVRVRLVQWAEELFRQRYLGRTFCMKPQNLEVEFSRSKLEVVLPWPRTFEVEARLDLRLRPTGESCGDL
jgi:uncharacterized protein DUF4127